MPKILLNYFFFMLSMSVFAQNEYSLKALTGSGDLELVGDTFKMQKETFNAFNKMKAAALKEGILIKEVSAYRSFKHQKSIWNRKYDSYISQGLTPNSAIKKIVEYSTLPGTSRHHWGTDIDIRDGYVKTPKHVLMESNYSENGIYGKLKNWMDANSEKFGFYLVYTNNKNRKGFKYEPWHYSYKPLSKNMLMEFQKIDLKAFYSSIKLKGSNFITTDFLQKYYKENVLDINPSLEY